MPALSHILFACKRMTLLVTTTRWLNLKDALTGTSTPSQYNSRAYTNNAAGDIMQCSIWMDAVFEVANLGKKHAFEIIASCFRRHWLEIPAKRGVTTSRCS